MFYFNREFYELNLSAFNSIISFLPNLDLDQRHVDKEFNLNAFWYTITRNYQHDVAILKAQLLGIPSLEYPNVFLLVDCLLGRTV